MPPTELQSTRYEVSDTVEAIELYYAKGWTDGLPVVPPTEGSIRAMLDAVDLDPGEEITFIENRQVSVTAEKVAINAVMAGCTPAYMPVVVAAIEAIGDPRWSYHGPATSTGGSAVFMLVNGPIARSRHVECQLPGLSHADYARSANDRHCPGGGAQPRPSLRRPWSWRGAHRAPTGSSRQCHLPGYRKAHDGFADVARLYPPQAPPRRLRRRLDQMLPLATMPPPIPSPP